jgi:hypothetical protein
MKVHKGTGRIYNHTSKELLVLETDSGPPVVHRLGPHRKSPIEVNADGFRRGDGAAILLHKDWWKVPTYCRADIFQVGDDLLIPVSLMIPVSDKHFGNYEIRDEADWVEKMTYVTSIIKDKRGNTTGYSVEGRGIVSVEDTVKLADAAEIDNVVVVRSKSGGTYLRTKKNTTAEDNLTT